MDYLDNLTMHAPSLQGLLTPICLLHNSLPQMLVDVEPATWIQRMAATAMTSIRELDLKLPVAKHALPEAIKPSADWIIDNLASIYESLSTAPAFENLYNIKETAVQTTLVYGHLLVNTLASLDYVFFAYLFRCFFAAFSVVYIIKIGYLSRSALKAAATKDWEDFIHWGDPTRGRGRPTGEVDDPPRLLSPLEIIQYCAVNLARTPAFCVWLVQEAPHAIYNAVLLLVHLPFIIIHWVWVFGYTTLPAQRPTDSNVIYFLIVALFIQLWIEFVVVLMLFYMGYFALRPVCNWFMDVWNRWAYSSGLRKRHNIHAYARMSDDIERGHWKADEALRMRASPTMTIAETIPQGENKAQHYRKELQEMRDVVHSQQMEIEKLKAEKMEMNKQMMAMEHDNQALQHENEVLGQRNEALGQKNEALGQKNEALSRDFDEHRSALGEARKSMEKILQGARAQNTTIQRLQHKVQNAGADANPKQNPKPKADAPQVLRDNSCKPLQSYRKKNSPLANGAIAV